MSIRRGIDATRLAAIVARPGIDPRVWVVSAQIEALGFDPAAGIFADVRYLHNGKKHTVHVASQMAGADSGDWPGYEVGDVVQIGLSMGDEDFMPVLLGSWWDEGSPPPDEFQDANDSTSPTTDRVIKVKAGKKYRVIAPKGATIELDAYDGATISITAKGSAPINITSEGTITINSPDVRLGPGSAPVARVGDLVAVTLPPMVAGPYPVTALPITPTATPGAPGPGIGQIVSGAATVKS